RAGGRGPVGKRERGGGRGWGGGRPGLWSPALGDRRRRGLGHWQRWEGCRRWRR
ncbi:hypothetical protein TIFTF001_056553, partial [Ficus carica]